MASTLSESRLKTSVSSVYLGTGSSNLAPPWSRDQVEWLGRGIAVLRLATPGSSRWFLGGGYSLKTVFPHEKTFEKVSLEKGFLFSKTKMNPWPSHLACAEDPQKWKEKLESLVVNAKPCFDNNHMTLWYLTLKQNIEISGPCIVLDGHHSRAAQKASQAPVLFGWAEAFYNSTLEVHPIYRLGKLAAWFESLKKQKKITEISETEASERIDSFEIIEPHRKWWAVVSHPEKHGFNFGKIPFLAVDILHRISKKDRMMLRTSTHLEEAYELLGKGQADVVVNFKNYPKEYIWSRALSRELFPQKSTYFYPKIPFGLLVQGLS